MGFEIAYGCFLRCQVFFQFAIQRMPGQGQNTGQLRFSVSGYPVSVSGVITVPVSASMYQTMVANIQSDGTMQVVTPMVQVPKVEPGNGEASIEAVTIQGHPMTMINAAGEHQVLQVISLKDANVLTKAMQAEVVKDEDSQQQQTVSSPE